MDVEFTDRYGGRPPSWLRSCHGQCEAMGFYPVFGHDPDVLGDEAAVSGVRQAFARPADPLSAYEARTVKARIDAGQRQSDGWYFIECEDCRGTGRCSWLTTVTRVPSWLLRGLQTCWTLGPSAPHWGGHPAGWFRRAWLTFKVAFLCDLGVRI